MGGLDLPRLTSFFSPGDATPLPSSQGVLPGERPPRSVPIVPGRLGAGTIIDARVGDAPSGFGDVKGQETKGQLGSPQLVRDPGDLSQTLGLCLSSRG